MTIHSFKTTATLLTDNVKQINGYSFLSTATLLKEAIWTENMNVLCIPSNLLSPNVVYELTMHRFDICFLKTSATLLTV